MDVAREIQELAARAKAAAPAVANLSTREKNAWLLRAAQRLEAAKERILAVNREDMREAELKGVAAPMVKRLDLAGSKWADMLDGLRQVAQLPDPVGEISEMRVRPNGLRVGRMRIPLGVIGIIYESRPNVTVDAAALCVKAGNAVILRGGSEAIRSNLALAEELRCAAQDTGLPEAAVTVVATTDRAAIDHLVKLDKHIDLIIPRGGNALIQRVLDGARVPVIKHDAGVVHVFLDASADAEMARAIAIDSKIRQVAVCNALDTLLCHEAAAPRVLPVVLKALHEEGVEIRGCARTRELFAEAVRAGEADWTTEYLDKILAVRVVRDLDEAIALIQRNGTEHTDVIVTNDYANAQSFTRRVNSSTVGVNCSTAFSDGYRLGLGAEIGISTSKLHAFGPMGLEELTTRKFVLFGDGQLRE
ncbi:MAG: glutamate-5-semialdehyde dehydrogenase [Deltaproteobacteria bacterium]|nr:glutamate-5-semialdehyde dehydrogenase [Deltaproteobacteria bacterium]